MAVSSLISEAQKIIPDDLEIAHACLMLSSACCLVVLGKKTKSMSTDRRGKSRTNKLIAVPPLRAKQGS